MPSLMRRFQMKPHCVVAGVPGWMEGGVYDGQEGTGAVRTVRLWVEDQVEPVEVLRGSVIEVAGHLGAGTH